MKYYIITGERSGDMHAGNLLREIKKLDNAAQVRGVGGDYLERAGATLSWNYSEIAVMGFAEVALKFREVLKRFSRVKKDVLSFGPDVLILVDFGGFNLRMAAFAKKHGIRVFYYITPKVWAWNQKRALKIKKLVDRMFVILPFEKDFYKKFDWEVDYVGNPLFDSIKAFSPDPDFKRNNNIPENKKIVALLPGSREQELKNVLPVYEKLIKEFKDVHFIIAGVKSLPEKLYLEVKSAPNCSVLYEKTYDILSISSAAIVTSGTATLETALFNVPQVVVYKTTAISYLIAKSLIRVKYISLVNLICEKEVVKEMIQNDMNYDNISRELDLLLKDETHRKEIFTSYQEIRTRLGASRASEKAAALMVAELNKVIH